MVSSWFHSCKGGNLTYLSIPRVAGQAAAIPLWAIDSYHSVATRTIFTWKSLFLTMRTQFVKLAIRKIKDNRLSLVPI